MRHRELVITFLGRSQLWEVLKRIVPGSRGIELLLCMERCKNSIDTQIILKYIETQEEIDCKSSGFKSKCYFQSFYMTLYAGQSPCR